MMHAHVSHSHDGEPISIMTGPCKDELGQDHVLHVIVPINNYVRYKRRYELFHMFMERMSKYKNVRLYVVEVAFGDRPFMCTDSTNPNHLQLRTQDEIWHKENSINLMIQRLPPRWKYVAWIDADITFLNDDIIGETIQQLQHYKVVQMFESVINKGARGQVHQGGAGHFKSFMYMYHQYLMGYEQFPYSTTKEKNKYANVWHPGFAWACTRKAYEDMGGLIEFAALGAGDHHMALALIGQAKFSLPGDIHPNYRALVMAFQERCETYIRRDVAWVPGIIVHDWHGPYKARKYEERWLILTNSKFDPLTDICKDYQGLWKFSSNKNDLRDGIRLYLRGRNEDSIDE